MAACMITYLDVTDQETFDNYRKAVVPSLEPYRVRPLVVDGSIGSGLG